ncbi:hypothetical protein NL108_017521 [Boleophthalmus pectinirostris]|nr:hypothetical protein NL108_017521 [Boleophthalmus pectinirostris]
MTSVLFDGRISGIFSTIFINLPHHQIFNQQGPQITYSVHEEFPSIQPFSYVYSGPGHGGSSLSRDSQTFLSTHTSSSSSGGTPRCSQASPETLSLQRVLGLPRGLLVECTKNTSEHCPGGIRSRCPSHLSCSSGREGAAALLRAPPV